MGLSGTMTDMDIVGTIISNQLKGLISWIMYKVGKNTFTGETMGLLEYRKNR